MILAPKEVCSGCTACQSVCRQKAIAMVADAEGFLYPKIDEAICVHCGMCEKVCPSLNRDVSRVPLAVYAARANDDELRLKSSSGGVFSLLARRIIARGGVVYGAGFDHEDWRVKHMPVENEDGLANLRGSKYVQSDIRGVFADVKSKLLSGCQVMFSGTPCQIAGLKHYLKASNIDAARLFLVDVVCHAVPSPLAWQKYLDERLVEDGLGTAIRRISFRRKSCGWKRYSMSLCFADGNEYLRDLRIDSFLRGFLSGLYNRPSCHVCQCRELRSGSDMTIADYWRVNEKFPAMDDDRGTSLLLVNTEVGEMLIREIVSDLSIVKSDYSDAVRVNPSLVSSGAPHRKRSSFFKKVNCCTFDHLVESLLKRSLWRRIASRIKRMVVRR